MSEFSFRLYQVKVDYVTNVEGKTLYTPPLNKVLLLPIPPPLPMSLFQETRVYKGTHVQISLFYNLLVGVKNIPNCRQIESSCGECIQNIDPPCSWCEDTVSTLCFLVGSFISFLIRGNFLIPIICFL